MSRLEQLQKKMKENKIQNLFIKNPYNIRYLTEFSGEDSVLIILRSEEILLVTDGRYTEQAKNEVHENVRIVKWEKSILEEVVQIISSRDIKKLYFEGNQLNYLEYEQLNNLMNCELKPVQGYIEELRAIKDTSEIENIKKAAEIVDKTFFHILNFIQPGITEKAVATEIEYFMKCNDAEGASFETIVASGIRSAYPHGEASNKVIELGDMITLDFGAVYQGYASDITRTIAVGNVDEKLEEIYQLVLQAEISGLKSIRDGISSSELDSIIRKEIKAQDMNQYFNHGAGHSIGLEIHEAPYISKNSKIIFQKNMVQTVEPGLYLPNLGGVRIEDDIIVQKGRGIILTQAPKKDLIKLPF